MREVTKLMIREFKIKQLGYDFMGYTCGKNDIYNFHHYCLCRLLALELK